MDSSSSTSSIFASVRGLLERLATEFPSVAESVAAAVSGAEGDAPIDRLLAFAGQAEKMGPEGWTMLAAKLADVLQLLFTEAGEGHPLVRAFQRVAADVGEFAAQAMAGRSDAVEKLDAFVMPLLDRLGAACVDAMMGEKG